MNKPLTQRAVNKGAGHSAIRTIGDAQPRAAQRVEGAQGQNLYGIRANNLSEDATHRRPSSLRPPYIFELSSMSEASESYPAFGAVHFV
jgi:hypothetical protein